MRTPVLGCLVVAALLAACTGESRPSTPGPSGAPTGAGTPSAGQPFVVTPVATLDQPWSMTFLPDGRALVAERPGRLLLVDVVQGSTTAVEGVPEVVDAGQGGLHDVILAPDTGAEPTAYLSWVEAGEGGTGGVVGRARLDVTGTPTLRGLEVIWRQTPRTSGDGHFSLRLAVDPTGEHLFVTSGERQKMQPAQDLTNTLGTIVRLTPDGGAAPDNPYAARGGVSAQIWSHGHRNPLGIAFDAQGRLWADEMGPRGGDEVNLIERGANYGWPLASNGSHYSGQDIPDHVAGDGFAVPAVWWNPSISPAGLMIYDGTAFPQWRGDAFLGALSGQALIRVDLDGTSAAKGDQWSMGARIREVEQGPDGAIWVLEDGDGGRLLRLDPAA